ncbi:hypothetical protein AMOR_22100 [Anaeromyxobacter oryzae]|uniref:histidine kinase n=1 Tax=Anaeromyxobacter oryzae TaxID=2918170 RepID=A0ABM7WUT9_9BACT|nr:hypothetical protein AMOR_22100 [Anaeromyxobacter oryzae]
MLLTAGVASAIAVAAALSFEASARVFRAEKEGQLAAIVAVKVEELARWRAERIADSSAIASDAMLVDSLGRTDVPALQEDLGRWFRGLMGLGDYAAFELLDPAGRVVVATSPPPDDEPQRAAVVATALAARRPTFVDLHRHGESEPQLELVTPVMRRGEPVGALLVRIDPRAYVYPLLRSWPAQGTSAETLLVREDGDALVVLNPVRSRPDAALALRLPAAFATGAAPRRREPEGPELLSAAQPVPHSPWTLIAQVPVAEAFAPLRERLVWTLGLAAALLAAVAAGGGLWWRQRVAGFERQRLVAEAERNAVARRLDRLTRWSRDLVFLTDDAHRIVEVNERAAEALGYTREELLRLAVPDLRDPATVADFPDRVREEMAHGALLFETRYRRKDGSTFPVEVSVHVDEVDGRRLFQGIARDISERVAAEQALRASEAKFRAAFEGARLGVALLDARGAVVEANPALCGMLGRSEAALRGEPLARLVEGGAGAELAAALERLGAGAIETVEGSYRLARAGGGAVDALLRAGALRGADTRWSALAFVEDVSEKRQLQARLQLADRMASLGTLAAGVAHEINNPLAFVLANVDHAAEVLRSAGRDPGVVAALDDARAGAIRVREIVRELRAFSRADAENDSLADVRRAARSAMALAENEIRHRAGIVLSLEAAPPVRGSEHRLGQVALNLLVNAAQAIPEGDAARHTIRVATGTAPDGRAFLEVSDTGAGIAPDLLPRIFDPFFTTKPVGVGTGLGLSICHAIVTGLGGEIRVESALGAGATFRVLLPAAAPDATVGREGGGPATVAPSVPRRGRVVVVDDEPLVGRAVQRVLAAQHDVVVLTAASAALAALAEEPAADVVLCDLMMPGMSGMELHARVRARSPRVADRFVFLTGGAFTAAAREFLDAVPNARIEKPFDPEALRAAVARLVSAPAAERA